MSLMTVFTVTHRTVGSPGAKAVLTMLAEDSNADWLAEAPLDHLAAMTELDAESVQATLSGLEDAGLIVQVGESRWQLDEVAINALPWLGREVRP